MPLKYYYAATWIEYTVLWLRPHQEDQLTTQPTVPLGSVRAGQIYITARCNADPLNEKEKQRNLLYALLLHLRITQRTMMPSSPLPRAENQTHLCSVAAIC